MVILGFVKFRQRHYLRHNARREPPLGGLFGFFGRRLLGVGMIKDNRTILCSDVGALPVHGGRVMGIPKQFEQFVVRNPLWVEGDLDDFGMPGVPGADFLISWVILLAPGVTA